jgi:hypothetical protein
MINSYLELIKKESNIDIDIDLIFNKVNSKLYDGIDEELIINEIAETCVNLISINPEYTFVASRILIKNLHDKTLNTFPCNEIRANIFLFIIEELNAP